MKIKLYYVNLILIIILVSSSLIKLSHNDFIYYGSTQTSGQLYKDIYFSYPPGSYFLNKTISLLLPNNYNYILMRIVSIFLFILSINVLANSFLKKNENKIYFLILTSLLFAEGALQIGSYSLSLLFFVLSLVNFFFGKNCKDFFFAGFFFGLCLITRSTYFYCVFFFIVAILKDKNWKKYLLYSTLGGTLGIFPYLYYFLIDFNSVLFWNYKSHLLHNEAYRWNGLLFFIKSILSRLEADYITMLPLLLPYFYYLFKNIYKRSLEFILILTLTISSLTIFVTHKLYFEPLYITILLFIIKYIKLSNLNRFIIISLLIISSLKYLTIHKNLDKSKYSYKNIQSIFSIMNTKKEIQSVIDKNFERGCNLVFRTTSSIYLPHGTIHHPFNLQGVWLFRLEQNIIEHTNRFFDYNNYINFYKKDFNALLVGYYFLDKYELKLIEYAEKENWRLFDITNFKLYVKNECN